MPVWPRPSKSVPLRQFAMTETQWHRAIEVIAHLKSRSPENDHFPFQRPTTPDNQAGLEVGLHPSARAEHHRRQSMRRHDDKMRAEVKPRPQPSPTSKEITCVRGPLYRWRPLCCRIASRPNRSTPRARTVCRKLYMLKMAHAACAAA